MLPRTAYYQNSQSRRVELSIPPVGIVSFGHRAPPSLRRRSRLVGVALGALGKICSRLTSLGGL